MAEVCRNGHVRTESNTSFVRDNARNRVRKRCLDCKRANKPEIYTGKGSGYSAELRKQERADKHEDIEDLIRFGATFEEIVQRSRYANWLSLSRSLREAGRSDLLEKLRRKRGLIRPLNSGEDVPGAGNSKRDGKRISLWA